MRDAGFLRPVSSHELCEMVQVENADMKSLLDREDTVPCLQGSFNRMVLLSREFGQGDIPGTAACDISVGTVMAVIESMVGWISAWLALARSICAVRAAECSEEFSGISRDVLIWANAVWPFPSHDESGGV